VTNTPSVDPIDPVDTSALVQHELEAGLPELEPVQFTVDHQLSDGPVQAVAWTYVGKPHPDAQFLGVRLREPMTLRGVTLVQDFPGEGIRFRWYIDWLDALNRAGLNAALRPGFDGRQPELSDLTPLIG
jgi:hypothetical protein